MHGRACRVVARVSLRVDHGPFRLRGRLIMSSGTELWATLGELYDEKRKTELVGGRIVPLMPTGRKPNRIAGRIFKSLDDLGTSTPSRSA